MRFLNYHAESAPMSAINLPAAVPEADLPSCVSSCRSSRIVVESVHSWSQRQWQDVIAPLISYSSNRETRPGSSDSDAENLTSGGYRD